MIHPLLQLIAREPELLSEHAGAYAELVATEINKTTTNWKARIARYAAALIFLTVGIIFTGVALLFCALMPVANMNLPWLLIVVPLLPMVVGTVCLFRARAENGYPALGVLKQQLRADLAMLREASAR